MENLLLSWFEFRKDKSGKLDVQIFERYLEDNLFALHSDLKNKLYRHQAYTSFIIQDPKRRDIHKATVRDRIVHHAIFRVLYPIFDPSFIFDSYSCRLNKGTHKAVDRLEQFVKNVSRNYTRPCFALKCDIAKFFSSIDHNFLKNLIARRITDTQTMSLLENIIDSFEAPEKLTKSVGGGHVQACPLAIWPRSCLPISTLTNWINLLSMFWRSSIIFDILMILLLSIMIQNTLKIWFSRYKPFYCLILTWSCIRAKSSLGSCPKVSIFWAMLFCRIIECFGLKPSEGCFEKQGYKLVLTRKMKSVVKN